MTSAPTATVLPARVSQRDGDSRFIKVLEPLLSKDMITTYESGFAMSLDVDDGCVADHTVMDAGNEFNIIAEALIQQGFHARMTQSKNNTRIERCASHPPRHPPPPIALRDRVWCELRPSARLLPA